MITSSPAQQYFEGCRGQWRAPLGLQLTDAGALRRSGMSLLDRVSVRLLASWPPWLGTIYLDTSVATDASEVSHTTVVRWAGLPVRQTVETFTLDPDGRRFTVHGAMTGSGSVDPTATRAEYTLAWLGVEIRQNTLREADRVTIHQEGPGFRGHHELRRR